MKDHELMGTMFCTALGLIAVLIGSHVDGFRVAVSPCNQKIVKEAARKSVDEHGIFERYGGSNTASERRERLDAFADYLNENQHFEAYIMSYGGRRTYFGEAKTLGRSAKRYLVRSKRIKSARITVIDGGYREDWVVELWYGVKGSMSPVALPTIDRKQVIMLRKHRR